MCQSTREDEDDESDEEVDARAVNETDAAHITNARRTMDTNMGHMGRGAL